MKKNICLTIVGVLLAILLFLLCSGSCSAEVRYWEDVLDDAAAYGVYGGTVNYFKVMNSVYVISLGDKGHCVMRVVGAGWKNVDENYMVDVYYTDETFEFEEGMYNNWFYCRDYKIYNLDKTAVSVNNDGTIDIYVIEKPQFCLNDAWDYCGSKYFMSPERWVIFKWLCFTEEYGGHLILRGHQYNTETGEWEDCPVL